MADVRRNPVPVKHTPKKSKRKKKTSPVPFMVLSAIFLTLFVAFSALTVKNILKRSSEDNPLIDVSDDLPAAALSAPDLLGDLKVRTGDVTYVTDMRSEFMPLYACNSDTVGWLRLPETSIDTVVVQNEKDDGYSADYKYLKTDFYGNRGRYGNLFLDYRCKKYRLSKNTIIYGHTTEGKEQVFYDLVKYEDKEFFKKNPIIEYGTLFNTYKWKVFAVFATSIKASDDNGYVFNYIYPDMSDSSFEGYLEQVYQRVPYKTGVDVDASDKILTLSTCSYNFDVGSEKITTRLVLVARLMREGESEEIDASAVKDNPDYRRPHRWYELKGKSNPYKNSLKWKPSAK
ncbi:MAG: class B sortase [Clostridiales bacterium]|jgi:sortase B|nr:class B sortase [Clostridiales bacterium]